MKYIIFPLVLLLVTLTFFSCDDFSSSSSSADTGEWLIPQDEVYDGGPGKDGIPALTDPAFTDADGATYLKDNDLVIGVRYGDEIRAYPHPILDWHEIINDTISTDYFSITYCPLTGSGISWDRVLDGEKTTFGVSGLLYNSNLIPYDRASDSNWSQMMGLCVNGEKIGTKIVTTRLVETTWKTWKELYPQTKVVSEDTGYNRPYGSYPYGDYRTSSRLLFPISYDDPRLHRKERIHGIQVEEKSKVYQIKSFPTSFMTINDTVNGQELVVVGNSALNIAASHIRRLTDGTLLTFTAVADALPAVMKDNEGTTWDILGKGLSGPRAGQYLEPTASFNAYWFAWGTFFHNAEIHFPH